MSAVQRALQTLHDVPGVDGAFVAHDSGSLLVRDPQLWIPEQLIEGICARVATMFEAVIETFEDSKEISLTFDSHRVVLRRLAPCVLGVLARPEVNAEALRMASNIALRHIVQTLNTPQLAETDPAPVPSSAPRIALRAPGMGSSSAPAIPKSPQTPSANAPARPATPPKKKKSDIWG